MFSDCPPDPIRTVPPEVVEPGKRFHGSLLTLEGVTAQLFTSTYWYVLLVLMFVSMVVLLHRRALFSGT